MDRYVPPLDGEPRDQYRDRQDDTACPQLYAPEALKKRKMDSDIDGNRYKIGTVAETGIALDANHCTTVGRPTFLPY
jgi:hypothetical protein